MSYTPIETQTPDEIPTAKASLDMPADVADEKEELAEQLSDRQSDSLDDDPTWSPEELERAYKAIKMMMMTVQVQMKILGTCRSKL